MQHHVGFLTSPVPLYFEEFMPSSGGDECVVLVHGGATTGACYLITPDGRPGWAYQFLQSGYRVVVLDWPGVGRSGTVRPDVLDGEMVCAALGKLLEHLNRQVTLLVHSMSGPYGLRLIESHGAWIKALVAVAPGPPGNIQQIPIVLREDDNEIVVQGEPLQWQIPKTGVWAPSETLIQDKILGKTRYFPRHALDAFRASLVPIPVRLIYERQNVRNSQIRVNRNGNFEGKRVLILTGSHDTDHPREVDGRLVTWLSEAGADVTFQFLGDVGIEGNGHMLMLEENSDQLANRVLLWLDK